MNGHEAIENNIRMGQMITDAYLADLNDEELMQRPHKDANHIKWQLGHLISAEHQMMAGCAPGKMPSLPEGFVERYTKETSKSDTPDDFDSKAQLLAVAAEQRAATLAILQELSAEDLNQPAPERMRSYAPTVGAVCNMQGSHCLLSRQYQ